MAITTCYTQLCSDGKHWIMSYRTGKQLRSATPEEVAKSDAAAELDGGVGLFDLELDTALAAEARGT